MPVVEFHTGLPDPLGFACRLLRKAWRQQARVGVTAPAARLAELDRQLWQFEEREFLPHVRVRPPPAARLLRLSPLWLAGEAGQLQQAADAHGLALPPVLLNLGAEPPAEDARFERVIELVGHEADEADAGRLRWRVYVARGCPPVHHRAEAR
jgi:DNA polymerase-3 subunit chi